MLTQKNLGLLIAWTAVLSGIIYLVFDVSHFGCFSPWLFIVSIAAGITFDFTICEWTHFNDKTAAGNDEDSWIDKFIGETEFNYQHYDRNWKNLPWFLFLVLHAMIVFLVLKFFFIREEMPPGNLVAFLGILLPYFFHKAYYYSVRIPSLHTSVYVYDAKKELVENSLVRIISVGDQVKDMEVIPREFNDCLFDTEAVVIDRENNINRKRCPVPCISQDWSYRQLLDVIFYQNNRSDIDSIYKTKWDKLNIYSGNDRLVRTCWEVKVETGSARSGIPMQVIKIADFSEHPFREDKVKVNGLIILERKL